MARQYKTFPNSIMVSAEIDGTEDYLLVHGNKQEALTHADPIRIGIYKLVEVQDVQSGVPVSKATRSKKTDY